MVKKERINLTFGDQAYRILDSLLKNAKGIYGSNGVSKSRIIEDMILKADPEKQIRTAMKDKQVEIMQLKDKLAVIQEVKRKK